MICFDLEFYVPKKDRDGAMTPLRVNPCKEGHHLVGGVLVNMNRDPRRSVPREQYFQQFWAWKEDKNYHPTANHARGEKLVLKKIFNFFQRSWNFLSANSTRKRKRLQLMLLGTGIARVDLPFLFIRSQKHQIAPDDVLFQTYLAGYPIDMTNVGLGRKEAFESPGAIKPIATSELMATCNMKSSKESGMIVWDWVDQKEYQRVEERTLKEVKINIQLYRCLFATKVRS